MILGRVLVFRCIVLFVSIFITWTTISTINAEKINYGFADKYKFQLKCVVGQYFIEGYKSDITRKVNETASNLTILIILFWIFQLCKLLNDITNYKIQKKKLVLANQHQEFSNIEMYNESNTSKSFRTFTKTFLFAITIFYASAFIISTQIRSSSDIWTITCPGNQIPIPINDSLPLLSNDCFSYPKYDVGIICIKESDNYEDHSWLTYSDNAQKHKELRMWFWVMLYLLIILHIGEIVEHNYSRIYCIECCRAIKNDCFSSNRQYNELSEIQLDTQGLSSIEQKTDNENKQ
jgi:hypothetical protein